MAVHVTIALEHVSYKNWQSLEGGLFSLIKLYLDQVFSGSYLS